MTKTSEYPYNQSGYIVHNAAVRRDAATGRLVKTERGKPSILEQFEECFFQRSSIGLSVDRDRAWNFLGQNREQIRAALEAYCRTDCVSKKTVGGDR